MADNEDQRYESLTKTLISSVESTLKTMGSIDFTADTESGLRDAIEYDSRMRVFGMEKFNNPCYCSAVTFYASENHKTDNDSIGAIIIFLQESNAVRLLNTVGFKKFDDEDEEKVLEIVGEFAKTVADNYAQALSKEGYNNLVLSDPDSHKNDIPNGVPFPYSQYKCITTKYHIWKTPVFAVDSVIAAAS